MRKQRGIFLSGPALYAAIAAGVLVVGLSVALKIQSSRLEAAKAELALCSDRYQAALGQIQRQNQAIKGLEQASEKARRSALEAQERARAAQKGLGKERERLAALKAAADSPCPAGDAVKRVREGLR